jgi:hypothetical protein
MYKTQKKTQHLITLQGKIMVCAEYITIDMAGTSVPVTWIYRENVERKQYQLSPFLCNRTVHFAGSSIRPGII